MIALAFMTTKPMTIQDSIPTRIPVLDEAGREIGHADMAACLAIITVTDPAAAGMLQREPRIPLSVGYSVKIEAMPSAPTAPARTRKRRLAVAALLVPMALWHWPRLIARDLADGYRAGRDRR